MATTRFHRMIDALLRTCRGACGLGLAFGWIATGGAASGEPNHSTPYFGIHCVDEATGRGIPLIELRTTNDIRCVSDSSGWIAFNEPGLMNHEVWFYLSLSPGYEKEKDGFGFVGLRTTPVAGKTVTLPLKRSNIAERIGRTTGQGVYRDSALLGLPCPLPNLNVEVMGQDSVQATRYGDRIFWIWGDTNVPQYPLGNFQTTGATTRLDLHPEQGILLEYFTDPRKPEHLRHMMPLKEHGAVWLFGLLTIPDENGKEALLAHFGRYQGLRPPDEHGVARFHDEHGIFESVLRLKPEEKWRFPLGNAARVRNDEGDYFYFAEPFCHTRVKATYRDLLTPTRYEALHFDVEEQRWRWQHEHPPTTQQDESRLVSAGKMPEKLAHYRLRNAASGALVRLHNATVHWNAYRKKFVLIALQSGGKEDPSPLGEMWYAESGSPSGPWGRAVKIASHPRYSFYNPQHHEFLDAEGGRVIYFEGTYSLEFSGNPMAPARYDYNQLLYRLDLSDERLKPAQD